MSTDDAEEKPYIPRKESLVSIIEKLPDAKAFWELDQKLGDEFDELRRQLKVGDLSYVDYCHVKGLLTQEALALVKRAKELGIPHYEVVTYTYNQQQ